MKGYKNAMAKTDVKVEVITVSIDKLKPREDNPRKINRKQYDELKKSLQEFPEMKQLREIIVDEDFNILAGTQRYFVQRELGYADLLVKQATGLTETQKRQFIIKDNNHSGEWDTDIIANLWDTDELSNWGITEFDFGKINEPNEPAAKDNTGGEPITCPNCGLEIEV